MNSKIEEKAKTFLWLMDISSEAFDRTGVDITNLLNCSLGRVVYNNQLKPVRLPLEDISKNDIRHITDWLTAATLRNEVWLHRCDEQGRPLKLLKFGSVEQIVKEADKAMVKWNNGGGPTDASEGTKVVHDAGDGYTIVKLTSSDALIHEGKVMGHCIGQGAYNSALATNFTALYSLRDRFGKSHITIEIDNIGERLEQLVGKQNAMPQAKYLSYLVGWEKLSGMRILYDQLPSGFGADRNNGIIQFSKMEPGEVFNGDALIHINNGNEFQDLFPDDVTINGNLTVKSQPHLTGPTKLVMPKNIHVNGLLRLDNFRLANLDVQASALEIRNCEIESISNVRAPMTDIKASVFDEGALEAATFEGSVDLQDCRFVLFERTTRISGNLTIAGCRLRRQPNLDPLVEFQDDFTLPAGRLFIADSHVTFNGRLEVGNRLEMRRSSVVKMPTEIQANGDVLLDKLDIDRMTDVINAGGNLTTADITETGLSQPPQTGPMR